jgi:tetratricopeptide (TPR) repeat protein
MSPGRPSRPARRRPSNKPASAAARRRPSKKPASAPARRPTAAERRAAEVRKSRGPRPPKDPDAERQAIESRTLEEWIDEGSLRAEATGAAGRARSAPRPGRPSSAARGLDAVAAAEIRAAARDQRRVAHLSERLAQAQGALERERFDDARRLAAPLLRELPGVPAVHEVVGLAAYRSGRWKQAVAELEAAQALRPSVEILPVLADAYRALRRWTDVDRVWSEVRTISPAQEILAEARIVAAGSEADRGDLQAALRTMARAKQIPRRVRDHHLRQWYVLGDLYDRAGDPLEAVRWFELVASHDPQFVDVAERLRALGR